jgi:hypothetical protein
MTDPKRPAIEYNPDSWEAGYQAGLDGKTATSKIPPRRYRRASLLFRPD